MKCSVTYGQNGIKKTLSDIGLFSYYPTDTSLLIH